MVTVAKRVVTVHVYTATSTLGADRCKGIMPWPVGALPEFKPELSQNQLLRDQAGQVRTHDRLSLLEAWELQLDGIFVGCARDVGFYCILYSLREYVFCAFY